MPDSNVTRQAVEARAPALPSRALPESWPALSNSFTESLKAPGFDSPGLHRLSQRVYARMLVRHVGGERGVLESLTLYYGLVRGDGRRTAALAERCLMGEPRPDQPRRGCLATLAARDWMQGDVGAAVNRASGVLNADRGERSEAGPDLMHLLIHGLMAATASGQVEDAQRLRDLLRPHVDLGQPVLHGFWWWQVSRLALLSGDLALADTHASNLVSLADENNSHFLAALGLVACGDVTRARGLHDLALRFYRDACMLALPGGFALVQLMAQAGQALVHLARNDSAAVMASVSAAFGLMSRHGLRGLYTACPAAEATLMSFAYVRMPGLRREIAGLIARNEMSAPIPGMSTSEWPYLLEVTVLGQFACRNAGGLLGTFLKRASKPTELLMMLVALDAREGYPVERLAAMLWPDSEGDLARRNLDTTLHRLRRGIGHERLVEVRHGLIRINRGLCHADVWDLRDQLAALQVDGLPGAAHAVTARRVASRFPNPLLDAFDFAWVRPLREQLIRQMLIELDKAAAHFAAAGDGDGVAACCERALLLDPLAERTYRSYMRHLIAVGERGDALRVFQRARLMLADSAKRPPSASLEALRAECQAYFDGMRT